MLTHSHREKFARAAVVCLCSFRKNTKTQNNNKQESGLSGQGQVVTSGTYYYHAVHPNNNSPRRPTPTTALTAAAQRAFNDEQQPAVPSNDEPFVQPTSPPTTEVIPLESAFNEVAKARQIHVAAKESLREAVDWTVSLTAKAAEATRHASSTQDLVNDLKMSAREHTRRAQESARTVASLQRDLLQLKERAAAAKARDESLATHTAEVEGLLRMKVERLARLGEKQHAQENRVVGLQVATWRYLEGRIMSEGNTVSHSEEGGAGNMLNVLALASLAEGVGAEELKGLHLSYEVDKTDLHDHIQEQAVAADKHREAAAGVAECEALLASAAHETEKARVSDDRVDRFSFVSVNTGRSAVWPRSCV